MTLAHLQLMLAPELVDSLSVIRIDRFHQHGPGFCPGQAVIKGRVRIDNKPIAHCWVLRRGAVVANDRHIIFIVHNQLYHCIAGLTVSVSCGILWLCRPNRNRKGLPFRVRLVFFGGIYLDTVLSVAGKPYGALKDADRIAAPLFRAVRIRFQGGLLDAAGDNKFDAVF